MPRGSFDSTEILEFFDYDNINTSAANGIRWLVSGDSSDTAFVATAAVEGPYAMGTLKNTNDNMIDIGHSLVTWCPQHGNLIMEVMFELDVITEVAFNVGFNDDALDDSNTLPVELASTAFTVNAATFIGLVFDTDADNDEFHSFWVDDSTDTTVSIANLRMHAAPTAGEWGIYKVELTDAGASNQAVATLTFIDHLGRGYTKQFNSTVDREALLTPYIGVENRASTAHIPKIKYIHVKKSIQ